MGYMTGTPGLYHLASLLNLDQSAKLRAWSQQPQYHATTDLVLRPRSEVTLGHVQNLLKFITIELQSQAQLHQPLHLMRQRMYEAWVYKDMQTMHDGIVEHDDAFLQQVVQGTDISLDRVKKIADNGRHWLALGGGHEGCICLQPFSKASKQNQLDQVFGTSFAPASVIKRASLPVLAAVGKALGPEHWMRGMCSLGRHAFREMGKTTLESSRHGDQLALFRDMRHHLLTMPLNELTDLLQYWILHPCDCVVDMDKLAGITLD
jgi:hypothetical protein